MVFRKFSTDETGAIAPLYALALFGLIGMAGVGFDYARVMALDTELQNAADQAALAAASQLDGKADSITRAQSAVRDFFAKAGGAYVNETRLSNIDDDADGNSRPITQVSFAFWADYVNDAPVNPVALDASDSSAAEIVQVTIEPRVMRYAMTPIVGAIVGRAGATAMASVESAYCKVPPLMVCEPHPNFGAPDSTGAIPDRGKGFALHFLSNNQSQFSSTTDVAGLFGFLNFPYPAPAGVSNPNTSTGWEVANAGCTGEAVQSEPGVRTPEQSAINTRFGFVDKGYVNDCGLDGTFCPSKNVQKDMVVRQTFNNVANMTDLLSKTCNETPANNASWIKDEQLPAGAVTTSPAGYNRDSAHTGNLGNGNWGFATYMSQVHGVSVTPGVTSTYPAGLTGSTRYDVYNWELDPANPSRLNKRKIGYSVDSTDKDGNPKSGSIYCAYAKPHLSDGIAPPAVKKDRRVLSVASVDCSGIKGGRSDVLIERYIDVFLVEPAYDTGSQKEFYIEVIGETPSGTNSAFQNAARRKAVLIR